MRPSGSTYLPSISQKNDFYDSIEDKNANATMRASASSTATFINSEGKFPMEQLTARDVHLPSLKIRLTQFCLYQPPQRRQLHADETSPLHIAVYIGTLKEVQNLLTCRMGKPVKNSKRLYIKNLAFYRSQDLIADLRSENHFRSRKPYPPRITAIETEMAEVENITKLLTQTLVAPKKKSGHKSKRKVL
jgi:hypothetical protein